MPSAGEIFDRIGWMLTTGAEERSRQAQFADEQAAAKQKDKEDAALVQQILSGNYGQQPAQPAQTTQAKPSGGTAKSTTTQPEPPPPPPDPRSPASRLNSKVLGDPMINPAPFAPSLTPRIPRNVFTGGTIRVGKHTFDVAPDWEGYRTSVRAEAKEYYRTTPAPGGRVYTQTEVELKSLIDSELATSHASGIKPNLPALIQAQNALGDVGSSFGVGLVAIDQWVSDGVPWDQVPKLLYKNNILMTPEVIGRVQDFLINKKKARLDVLFAGDPVGREAAYRGVDHEYGRSSPEPYAKVGDTAYAQTLAEKNISPDTPVAAITGGQGGQAASRPAKAGAGGIFDQASELERYRERERMSQQTAMKVSGTQSFIDAGIAPIMHLMHKNKGKDMTGPMDPLKDKIDQWGIPFLSNMDRVKLRSYSETLFDMLYKNRGMQLAVKEIEKAAHLIPDPKSDEQSYLQQLDVFTDYIIQHSRANMTAMHLAGVDIGAANIRVVEEYQELQAIAGNKLQFDYLGPYTLNEKTGKKDYIVLEEE